MNILCQTNVNGIHWFDTIYSKTMLTLTIAASYCYISCIILNDLNVSSVLYLMVIIQMYQLKSGSSETIFINLISHQFQYTENSICRFTTTSIGNKALGLPMGLTAQGPLGGGTHKAHFSCQCSGKVVLI